VAVSRARYSVTAEEFLPFGARILVRHGRASLASENLANATVPDADHYPWFAREAGGFDAGQHLFPKLDESLGSRSLQDIANGPIMAPGALYLPAGICSEAEWRRRNRDVLDQLGRKQATPSRP
jgi:hypothetical protein